MNERDQEDFSEFMRAHWAAIFRTAFLLTGDHHHSQDLAQIAFSKAYLAWGRVQAVEHPAAYVRKMLVNETISWRRRRSNRETPALVVDADARVAGPDASVPGSVTLWNAVLALPARQRAVVVLRYYEDLSEAEIAGVLDVAVGTVKSSASAARQTLARRLAVDIELQTNGGAS